MNIRIVKARHGWLWLVAGMRLLRAAPLQWLLLIGILFVASRVLFLLPLAPLLAVLVAPHFLAGLAHEHQIALVGDRVGGGGARNGKRCHRKSRAGRNANPLMKCHVAS